MTITRDDWGIAHVHGHSDADAVFGAIYAQAEDDFGRIEANYLTALGRTAEAEGESAIWADLRQRLYVDPVQLQKQYRQSPAWLRKLMDAWADGLNFYLATHPGVHPRVLTQFEPWMALSFTEGSIGGDIERISLSQLQSFYEHAPVARTALETGADRREPSGSNGIAIAPGEYRQRPRPPADQPAHQLLFPFRAPDEQRRGSRRLWREHLGSVLHLSGLQPQGRLDAHLVGRG